MQMFVPYPGAVIDQSVVFAPGVYDFTGQEGLVVTADNIRIDGNGAQIRGGGPMAGAGDAAGRYFGTGLKMEGRVDVQVRNLSLSGFDVGVRLTGCTGISLEGCDLSDCFHDPDWGWDDHGSHGGFLLLDSHHCEIRHCRANRVWDAAHLRHSGNNLIENNDFSHTSNTGLKMWRACKNRVLNNNLSWGLRISPGEVHARDSSCVLLESGSDDNVFKNNDMTHGGDGFFIRVLNGWMSCRNHIEGNDCSYANNNGFEAWADHNTYINNKANHCSYGFWLGNSNHTILLGNEAAFNGRDFHNAPEAFGNAGITFANGSCSHSVIKDNHIHDNLGPGIALRDSAQTPSLHVLIAGNRIENNQSRGQFAGHGIYLKNARLVYLQDNHFSGNAGEDVRLDGNTRQVFSLQGASRPGLPKPLPISLAPGYALAGQTLRFETATGEDGGRWDFGDGAAAIGRTAVHRYARGGLYAVSLTSLGQPETRLNGLAVHVLPADFRPLDVQRAESKGGTLVYIQGIYGLDAPHLTWESGTERQVRLNVSAALKENSKGCLVMQLQYQGNQEPDWDRKHLYPVVTLLSAPGEGLEITPDSPMLPAEHAPSPEQRGSGRILLYPLDKAPGFGRRVLGRGLSGTIIEVVIDCGRSDAQASSLTLNAIGLSGGLESEQPMEDLVAGNFTEAVPLLPEGNPKDTGAAVRLDAAPLDQARGVLFGTRLVLDRAEAALSLRPGAAGAGAGAKVTGLEALRDGQWRALPEAALAAARNNLLTFSFEPMEAEGLRLTGVDAGLYSGLEAMTAGLSRALPGTRVSGKKRMLDIHSIQVKLNREASADGGPLPDLTAAVHELDSEGRPARLLCEARVPEKDVQPYHPLNIPFQGLKLMEGEAYALVLGQARLSPSREAGGYYRWICGRLENQPSLATLAADGPKAMEHDWGTGWLAVAGEGAQTRLDHNSSHVGVRLGLEEVPRRYQVFKAPLRASLLTDRRMSGPCYLAEDETLLLRADAGIRGLYLYLGKTLPERLTISLPGGGQPQVFTQFVSGINYLELKPLGEPAAALELTLDGRAELAELVAV